MADTADDKNPNNVTEVDHVQGDNFLIQDESIFTIDITPTEYIPVLTCMTIFGILSIIGISSVIFFAFLLYKGNKRLVEYPFFTIVYHLTLANVIHLTGNIVVVIPMMFTSTEPKWYYSWGVRVMEFSRQASLYLILLMALNRLIVFVFPSIVRYFKRTTLMIICTMTWVLSLFIVFWNSTYGVLKNFKISETPISQAIFGDNLLTRIFILSESILPLVMLAIYGIIFVAILHSRKKIKLADDEYRKNDKSLLWQALIVTVFLEVTEIVSLVTPFIVVPEWIEWCWTMFLYSVNVASQMSNPVVFLLYNRVIKNIMKAWWYGNKRIVIRRDMEICAMREGPTVVSSKTGVGSKPKYSIPIVD